MWIIVGILLRITRVRDHVWPLSLVFYSTPWPAIAAGLLVLAAHAWRQRRMHATRRYHILTGGAIFTWFALSKYSAPEPPPVAAGETRLRVVDWNVGRPGEWRRAHVVEWLRKQDADVIALAEALPDDGGHLLPAWAQAFPEYKLVPLPSEMLCLVRGTVLTVNTETSLGGQPSSVAGVVRTDVKGVGVTIIQADLVATPTKSRREPMARLAALAGEHAGPHEATLLLGDWNTPRDSAFFGTMRDLKYQHAFERVGNGFVETWPVGVGVLSIDQMWCNTGRLTPVNCRIGGAVLWSDHQPVVGEFGVR